ncbi:class II fructose-bisphosphate aldolase [Venenivibrio stagnispumantis]|uniref:Fructose/tagatose bisphosphate aldolase n=1 Tax=Venenivibrio stagnispumantis TaxID=407998 RepID=A0AA46AFT1_9AQUI|nr:class II fructose-bisphosphate aldolase [Venenivibrio stagnispumantis]MCW4573880.1 class II fructose-bisphosphate aldolase [Venenivibrio stagnispumantis]SMP21683.1 Fructose/tagatose bisphosphate aldolase [Venenivibrio stagnispumantis]
MARIAKNLEELNQIVNQAVEISDSKVKIKDENKLRESVIDDLIYTAVFSENEDVKEEAKYLIREIANEFGAIASSIHDLYMAMGRGETKDFTTPAVNIRGMTYDVARRMFKVAIRNNIGAFIFEIAKSEIEYTFQRPSEYASCILAAAIKEGYKGPVFIQGDHFQFSAKKYFENPEKELKSIQALTKEAIDAGFYNIDIDPSTLVDYSKESLLEQQYHNYLNTAKMTDYIREIEPQGINVSIGAEIGHIGGKNSTVEEFEAFMEGYLKTVNKKPGISKISVQTGTEHGGIPLPDGTVAKVKLDFNVLKSIGEVARKKYGLSGTVQHGASTLPDELFDKFPQNCTSEIHLATGFQNIMFDLAPEKFKEEIYRFIEENFKDEWKEGMTREQFLYKSRKRGFGPFKYQWWTLENKEEILDALEKKFEFLFEKLNVFNTREYTDKYIKLIKLPYVKYSTKTEKVEAKEIKLEAGAD